MKQFSRGHIVVHIVDNIVHNDGDFPQHIAYEIERRFLLLLQGRQKAKHIVYEWRGEWLGFKSAAGKEWKK